MNSQNRSRRLDAYIRVSRVAGREGDSFISPDVQEERIRAWAVAYGHEIIKAHHELDVSGGTMDRPKLNEVIRRIDAGETEGVVVFNLSRFGRTTIGGLELIDRINKKGALFASVMEGIDTRGSNGKLITTIFFAIAEAERERSRENWQTSRAKAVGRKIHVASVTPFGYRRGEGPINPRTGKPSPAPLEIDPVTGPYATEIFRRRAAGESWMTIVQLLVENNVPTVQGGVWAGPTLRAIIRNRTYLGIAGGAPDDVPGGLAGAHPALVDETTWLAAQIRRGMRHDRTESPSVLRGLVRCAGCRYSMQSGHDRTREQVAFAYACHTTGCPAPSSIVAIAADGRSGLDDAVIAQMWEHLEQIRFEGLDQGLDVAKDDEEIAALEAKRERDALNPKLEASMGPDGWTNHLAKLTARITELKAVRAEKLRQMGGSSGRPVAELRSMWESGVMTMGEKRSHIAGAIQMVFVKPGRAGNNGNRWGRRSEWSESRRAKFANRAHIVWATDPVLFDIPRQGKAGYVIKPFRFADADPDEAGVVPSQPEMEDAGDAVG